MKRLFLSLFLSFNIIFPSSFLYGMTEEECNAKRDQGYEWNGIANRCFRTPDSLQTQAAFEACASDPNPKECAEKLALASKDTNYDGKNRYEKNEEASDKLDEPYFKAKVGRMPMWLVHAMIIGISTYSFMYWSKVKKTGASCKPASMILMTAGAASLLAAELYALITYATKVKKLKDDFKDFEMEDKESDDYSVHGSTKELTLKAYDALIEQEKVFKQVSEIRRVGYGAATASFAGAFTLSAIELVKEKIAQATPDQSDNNDPTTGVQHLCPRLSADEAKALVSQGKPSKQSGSGKFLGMNLGTIAPILLSGVAVPLLMGMISKGKETSSIDNSQLFNQKEWVVEDMNISTEKKAALKRISDARNMKELTVVVEENQMFKLGALSSSSLKDYEKSDFDMPELEGFSEIKRGAFLSEVFSESLETINFLQNNSSASL